MSNVLFVLAAIFFAIAALLGFGVVDGGHLLGWIGLGSACFAAGHLPLP